MVKQLLRSLISLIVAVSFISVLPVSAQMTGLQCGSILENQFTANAQIQDYSINLNPLDRVTVVASPLGTTLSLNLALYDPVGGLIVRTDRGNVSATPRLESPELSSSGTFTISAANARYQYNNALEERAVGAVSSWQGGIGVYSLLVSCVLRDGTIINAGDTASPVGSNVTSPLLEPAFSGRGFPGLTPVDFASISEFPLEIGVGTITANNQDVIGFVFDANGGEMLNLNIDRLSGNLNLGVVVLSPDNQVVSYGGLIVAENFSTGFVLPSPGKYTIGVFQINLLPPDSPQATAFRVTGEISS